MKPKIPMEIVPTSLIELVEVLGWFEGLSGQNHNRAGLEFEAIQIWFFSKLNLKRKLITSTSPNIFLRFLCSSAGKKISDCGGLLLVETLMYHNTKKKNSLYTYMHKKHKKGWESCKQIVDMTFNMIKKNVFWWLMLKNLIFYVNFSD